MHADLVASALSRHWHLQKDEDGCTVKNKLTIFPAPAPFLNIFLIFPVPVPFITSWLTNMSVL